MSTIGTKRPSRPSAVKKLALPRVSPLVDLASAVVDSSGDWVTASQLAQMAGLSTTNPSAQPNKWKRQGLIFAINHNSNDYFPIFALDPEHGYRPFKFMKAVLEVFGESKSGWGLAYWFAGVNGFLGGKRPQDILLNDPERVVAAAEDEVMGLLHG